MPHVKKWNRISTGFVKMIIIVIIIIKYILEQKAMDWSGSDFMKSNNRG